MKKYLFNKIKVDGDGVNFIPFRQASIAESFLANTNLSTNQKDWKFSPSSFKTFLKMLSKTKLAGNYEYNIKINSSLEIEEPIPFDVLLQEFAAEMFEVNAPTEKALQEFYTSAYKIKEEATL